MTPAFLRTPESRFEDLADYPFAPHYFDWDGLRMHYVDEGAGPVVLLLHGEPTWSYLYRKMIPILVAGGFRCIAPDWIGFGKSDKVIADDWYTIPRHIESCRALLANLGVRGITLVCQDWGGPIGLRQVTESPENFERLVILNTWLHHEDYQYTEGIRRWRAFATSFEPASGDIPAGMIATTRLRVDDAARASARHAYDGPFVDASFKAGARRFPFCIPFAEPQPGDAVGQARDFEALKAWSKPAHFYFGDRDDVFTPEWGVQWAAMIPGATFEAVPGGHFVQEESGEFIAREMVRRMS